ncbi:squalene/phytoene synthase family protein [Streptomyces hyaluromycini]|uniref:squalene/phytoene synthase family protein n=1 Tax=Streptomyces hyaluromycini TaxID=1377993 RepID=UPI000B5CE573|nr:squalene/phytoene synthase family protein [Streptomyces hyaluromycini]
MSAWNKTLTAAGITDPELRRDYGTQRRAVRQYRRSAYLACRVLLPPAVLPHVVAATAVMHHGDVLLDSGPKPDRAVAWAAWERRVRTALETGTSDDPLIRTLLHTVSSYPRHREVVESYLTTAAAELEFDGFATEADYQAYVDAYSLPAFLPIAGLLGPESDTDGRFRAGCRTLIDGSQRLDFVNDLAEDLREGHLGIPAETLKHFSVTVEDLEAGRASDGLRSLVEHEVERARTDLRSGREVLALMPAPHRPMVSALIEIELMTAEAVLARGTGVLRGSASPSTAGTLRLLFSARRAAVRAQR